MTEQSSNLHETPSWMGRPAPDSPAPPPEDLENIHEVGPAPASESAGAVSSSPRFVPVDSGSGSAIAGDGTVVESIGSPIDGPTERITDGKTERELWPVGSDDMGSRATTVVTPETAAAKPHERGSALTTLLFTWASVATLLAVWLWLRWPEEHSPLETLPDDGIYKNGKQEIISPLEKLSSREMFRLGQTRQIGSLEITPLAIEHRSVRLLPDKFHTDPVLVLHLRIRNVSADQRFYPTDPAYLYPDPKKKLKGVTAFDRTGYTYSFLHSARAVENVLTPFDLAYSQGFRVEGQEFAPLDPGAMMETLVISSEDAATSIDGEMVWRIKLRKGVVADGRGIATVIGVAFSSKDVTTPSS